MALKMQLFGSQSMTMINENLNDHLLDVDVNSLFPSNFSSYGLSVLGTPDGVTVAPSTSSQQKNGSDEPKCMLFVGCDSSKTDFENFKQLAQNYAGTIILIVTGDNVDQERWIQAAGNEQRLYRCFSPDSASQAQNFAAEMIRNILIYQKLNASQMIW